MYQEIQDLQKIPPVSLAYHAEVSHTELVSWLCGHPNTG